MTDSLREAIARAIMPVMLAGMEYDAVPPEEAFTRPRYTHLKESAHDLADAALSAIRESGCVVVPREPTGKMLSAVRDCPELNHYESVGQFSIAWPLALSASPYEVKP